MPLTVILNPYTNRWVAGARQAELGERSRFWFIIILTSIVGLCTHAIENT
jgi:hypothetical protein